MNLEINDDTKMGEAIEILKQQADVIANSEEGRLFNKENPGWSTLFRQSFKPYKHAVEQYEEALKLNEWLNGQDPNNANLTIQEIFSKMPDQQRLSLFNKRVNTDTPGIFDEYLKAWWINRY